MSEEKTIPVSLTSYPLEEKLLDMMADQQAEFGTFRKNVLGRLAQLEHRPRRSIPGLLDMDFESIASMAILGVGILIFARILMYVMAQSKIKGETNASSSLSQA